MRRNIDKINDAYSILFILYIVIQGLNLLYKHLVEESNVTTDTATLIVLIMGFIIIKWLFKKSKKST